jgi:hypothetical protein
LRATRGAQLAPQVLLVPPGKPRIIPQHAVLPEAKNALVSGAKTEEFDDRELSGALILPEDRLSETGDEASPPKRKQRECKQKQIRVITAENAQNYRTINNAGVRENRTASRRIRSDCKALRNTE